MKDNCESAFDRIEIYDGKVTNSSWIETLCGKASSVSFTSSSNVLYVKFLSDDRVQNRGFHAVYKFYCPKTTTEQRSTKVVITNTTTLQNSTEAVFNTKSISTESIGNSTAYNKAVSDTSVKVYHLNSSHMSLIAMFVEPKLRRSRIEQPNKQLVTNTTEPLGIV